MHTKRCKFPFVHFRSSLHTFAYEHDIHNIVFFFFQQNVVTFLLCYYLFRQACHVKRATQQTRTTQSYSRTHTLRRQGYEFSFLLHWNCIFPGQFWEDAYLSWTFIIYAYFWENRENVFVWKKIHFLNATQRSFYVIISTNQNNCIQWTEKKSIYIANIW